MNEPNPGTVLCQKIADLRRQSGMTQEALAQKLGVTFQAVSKWETGQSCPDIDLLPRIADIFDVKIDALFGRKESEQSSAASGEPFWEDDGKIRAAVYLGRKLLQNPTEEAGRFSFEYRGEARDVISYFSLQCGDVGGNASAQGEVRCGDVGGSVHADGSVSCGDVGGNIQSDGAVNCSDVGGSVVAASLKCQEVSGCAVATMFRNGSDRA